MYRAPISESAVWSAAATGRCSPNAVACSADCPVSRSVRPCGVAYHPAAARIRATRVPDSSPGAGWGPASGMVTRTGRRTRRWPRRWCSRSRGRAARSAGSRTGRPGKQGVVVPGPGGADPDGDHGPDLGDPGGDVRAGEVLGGEPAVGVGEDDGAGPGVAGDEGALLPGGGPGDGDGLDDGLAVRHVPVQAGPDGPGGEGAGVELPECGVVEDQLGPGEAGRGGREPGLDDDQRPPGRGGHRRHRVPEPRSYSRMHSTTARPVSALDAAGGKFTVMWYVFPPAAVAAPTGSGRPVPL